MVRAREEEVTMFRAKVREEELTMVRAKAREEEVTMVRVRAKEEEVIMAWSQDKVPMESVLGMEIPMSIQ